MATFYAVALLSASRALGDQTLRLEMQAGAVALEVFGANPDHPGAPHYAIHAFDDPVHAPLALAPALRYAEIAPAVAHARHMPTHIFIQHGMWDLVSSHNQSSYDAALALWQPGDSVGATVHPLDWGQYGDLQRGDYAKARTWIERLEMVAAQSNGAFRATSSLPRLRARYVVETEEWRTFPVTDEASSPELLATALSATHTDDMETAKRAAGMLEARAKDGDAQVRIMHKEAAALVALANRDADTATQLMDEAIAIAEGLRPPNGAANPIKPPYELYGEMLLELNRPASALIKFETSLLRLPKRARSLLGAARAAAKSGDQLTARERYRTLMAIWHEYPEQPAFLEAQRFVRERDQ